MKDNLKLKLQFFADNAGKTIDTEIGGTLGTLRTDGNGYVDGYTIGQIMNVALMENSWLIPGQTFTRERMTDAGTMIIPMIDKGTPGGVTDLCEDGKFATTTGGTATLMIDKKISGKFDGCFTVAGIADRAFQNAENSMQLKMMAEDYQAYVMTEMLKVAKESELDTTSTTMTNAEYFTRRLAEYRKLNHISPDYALVSSEYLTELEVEIALRQSNAGDAALINGFSGVLKGIPIIEQYDQTDKIILVKKEAIRIGEPTDPKQIPNTRILGAYQAGGDASGFDSGMISIYDVQASKGIVDTWTHKFFGVAIVSVRMITRDKQTTPATRSTRTAKSAE